MEEILLKKNLPHVVTILNKNGETESLNFDSPLNLVELAKGVAELNKNGIVLTNIKAGVSKEGTTKVADVSKAGLFINDKWIIEPSSIDEEDIPEVSIIPFKSDSWILGEFIVQYITKRSIPKKFLKSQTLLDKFSDNVFTTFDLKKLLVLDPEKRSYTWEVVNIEGDGNCSIM